MAATYKAQINALQKRVAALEAESAIRAVVARYMEICDDLGPDAPMKELGQLFSKDAVWVGSGKAYKKAFGGHKGRDAIVAFLDTYRTPKPHFASNVNFLTSESLNVRGERATGSWVMLQTPSFAVGESFILAARLQLNFKFEDGAWRISQFQTTNLFGRPIEGGWHSSAPIPVPDTKPSETA